jgi:hypothetical protein
MQGLGRDSSSDVRAVLRPHPTLLQDPWVALFQKHARNVECDGGDNTTTSTGRPRIKIK